MIAWNGKGEREGKGGPPIRRHLSRVVREVSLTWNQALFGALGN